MTRQFRWTEHAATQLGTIAEYISLASPVYAEQVVDRVVRRLVQAQIYPESGRIVPELDGSIGAGIDRGAVSRDLPRGC